MDTRTGRERDTEGRTPGHTTAAWVCVFAPGRRTGKRPLSLLFLLALVLLTPACAELELLTQGASGGPGPPPSGSLSVSFIDVGQGDGVLVQAGGESYLIDAGRPEEGPNVVDFLRSRGVDELDGIVVSNPDADHIGGFLDVFDAFPVETVYVSGDPNSTLTYNTFLRGVSDEGSRTEVLRAGMVMDWGGVRADVVGPPTDLEGGLFTEINDNSVAILLSYGTARILLAGDAEAAEEEYMAGGPYTGPLTILIVVQKTKLKTRRLCSILRHGTTCREDVAFSEQNPAYGTAQAFTYRKCGQRVPALTTTLTTTGNVLAGSGITLVPLLYEFRSFSEPPIL